MVEPELEPDAVHLGHSRADMGRLTTAHRVHLLTQWSHGDKDTVPGRGGRGKEGGKEERGEGEGGGREERGEGEGGGREERGEGGEERREGEKKRKCKHLTDMTS